MSLNTNFTVSSIQNFIKNTEPMFLKVKNILNSIKIQQDDVDNQSRHYEIVDIEKKA